MEVHGFAASEQYVRSALPYDVPPAWPVQNVNVSSVGLDGSGGAHLCLSIVLRSFVCRVRYLYNLPPKGGRVYTGAQVHTGFGSSLLTCGNAVFVYL